MTYSTGVPTVWLGIRDELKRSGRTLPHLERVIIGGSALPPSLYDDLTVLGIETKQGWGMTEMSPIGSMSLIKDVLADAPAHVQRASALKQGVGIANVRWKIVDPDGRALPHDGVSRGELLVRGPWITGAYYRNEAADALAFEDGWFKTGDICTIDELGSMQIVDRVKDMIKSGGEWMSSIDLENVLMSHPSIKEAVVIGVPHPRWIERPIAVAVVRDGLVAEEAELRAWLRERVAKFEVPDRVLFVDALPRTGVGKFAKRILRERYENVLLES